MATEKKLTTPDDPTAESRKRDHIALAFESQVQKTAIDHRFQYEPLLSGHPQKNTWQPLSFAGKIMRIPLWVSSMTGGTEWAKVINHNLAHACRDFGMGMGLGSCRSLLHSDDHLPDFDVRSIIGDDLPLYANLGIAQLEQLLKNRQTDLVHRMLDKLRADGLIIHVNPLQEAMQPEGDIFERAPIDVISEYLEHTDRPVMVKEVGQGMGYRSLKALLQLPLQAIDFAASGGTNFALLELLRTSERQRDTFLPLAQVGHTAEEMVDMVNQIIYELGDDHIRCREVIISGGIKTFLDGYYLTEKIELRAVYGQASGFLAYARGHYDDLANYVNDQVRGLSLAKSFLKVR